MPIDDKDLKPADIQLLSSSENVAAFFSSLGYNTDDKSGARIKQSVSALGITPDAIAKTIKHVERLADQENGSLQVYLFELSSVTVIAIRALARAFRDRAGKYLLVLTSDYESIDFIFLERVLPPAKEDGIATKGVSIRPHVLTVKRRNPEAIALRVLRRFTNTESDSDAQADKLLSAFGVAEWSEKLFNNRALFSDYYLLERLPQSAEWSEQIKPQLLKLRELFSSVREKFGNQKEAVVREKLLQPVFELLGFTAAQGKDSKSTDAEPDYRLFKKNAGTSGKPLAICLAYTWNRYLDGKDETRDTETPDENPGAHVVRVLEAGEASWAIVTNGKVWRLYSSKAHSRATNYYEIDLEETLAMQDPQEAFRFFWLLFRAQAFAPVEEIQKGEKRTTTFLDRLIDESEAYAKELGEKLKSRVFDDIFPHFAEGFIEHMGGAEHFLSLSEEEREQSLREVFQGTLTFLYRLLFLLYSESRNLLPVNEVRGYWDLSLSRFKKEIADHAGTIIDDAPEKIKKAYRQDSSELYTQLSKLFSVIDQGDADVNVPLYNGGLFITNPAKDDESPETRNARFLRMNKIPDRYLALGIDMMARGEDNKTHALVAIDYKSLGVRHLGSIYEGLLEFKLRIATEKMAVVKGKKTEEVISYKEAKKNELPIITIGRGKNAEERTYKIGKVYLQNDKRERKATGSYYTPDYIVKYIVENTVGPVLAEKLNALRPKLREAQAAYYQAVKRQEAFIKQGIKGDDPAKTAHTYRHLVDDIFDIKVLDPAMGSGHFLVEAVDFVSDKIMGDKEGFLRAFPWNPITAELQNTRQTILNEMEKQGVSIDKNRLTDVNLLKRHILKRCIYGVDLNPMAVELAKVSLWLDCFTLGAPLSFLDHHLRSGNSLIGILEKEFEDAQKGQLNLLASSRFTGAKQAVGGMIQVGATPDLTADQARESRKQYNLASAALAPVKRLFDVYTSQWFGNTPVNIGKGIKAVVHNHALEFLRDGISEQWAFQPKQTKLPKPFDKVAEVALHASDEKAFFHWELEFPEVFYGPRLGSTQVIERLEKGGFDVVIGNPPYVGFRDFEYDKSYIVEKYSCATARFDLYMPFLEQCTKIVRSKGYYAFICPSTFTIRDHGKNLRKILANSSALVRYHDFLDLAVFDGAQNYTCICIFQNDSQSNEVVYSAGSNLSALRTLGYQLTGESWDFKVAESPFATEKFLIQTIHLEKMCPEINEGIVTGKNAAFVRYHKFKSSKSNELLHELMEGQNVDRFIATSSAYLIYPYRLVETETKVVPEKELKSSFSDVYDSLREFKAVLEARSYLSQTSKFWYELWRPREIQSQARHKIICPKLCNKGTFALVDKDAYFLDTVYGIPVDHLQAYSPFYLLAILNSRLITTYLRTVCPPKANAFFSNEREFLSQIPIRIIRFNTSQNERKCTYDKLVKICWGLISDEEGEGINDVADASLTNLLEQIIKITNDAMTNKVNDGQIVDGSDIIHDVLCYLAELMIDFNKQEQTEVNRYLGSIAKELKINAADSDNETGVDALTGKTALRKYAGNYQTNEKHLNFHELWDVLQKNKNRIGRTLDAAFHAGMNAEYEKSLSVLLPIKQKLAATDRLIDQIVYRLYGLTDEEIAVVEVKK